ncbi:MAG: hypothetical protein J7605_04270 [Variovorax sp.]|nr:hypothetical protein [Variovorax sp.]
MDHVGDREIVQPDRAQASSCSVPKATGVAGMKYGDFARDASTRPSA